MVADVTAKRKIWKRCWKQLFSAYSTQVFRTCTHWLTHTCYIKSQPRDVTRKKTKSFYKYTGSHYQLQSVPADWRTECQTDRQGPVSRGIIFRVQPSSGGGTSSFRSQPSSFYWCSKMFVLRLCCISRIKRTKVQQPVGVKCRAEVYVSL